MNEYPQETSQKAEQEQVVERIEKSKMQKMNDPGCTHIYKEELDDCGIPGHKALKCIYCPVGIIVKK